MTAGCTADDGQTTNELAFRRIAFCPFNPLVPTLKSYSIGPLYSNTIVSTLAVDGWAVTFGKARSGMGTLGPRPVPSSLYQM